jgi:hypothetical protein
MDDGAWPGDILDSDGVTICEMTEPMPFPMAQEIVCAVNAYDDLIAQRDALVEACEGLHDTVQDLRHVINGALMGESAEIPENVRRRGKANIKQAKAALALVRGESDDKRSIPFQAAGSDNWRDGKAHAIVFGDGIQAPRFNVHLSDENTKALAQWLNELWSASKEVANV